MASRRGNDQHTAGAGASTQASTAQTSERPSYDPSAPDSLTNLPSKDKYLKGFPPPWEPVPLHLTLRQICEAYPNHLDYEGLDPFVQWGWSVNQIWDTIPKYIQERIKKEKISEAQDMKTMYQHRRDRRYKALGGRDGVKTLWESKKLRGCVEGVGGAITFGLNPNARNSRAGWNKPAASTAGNSAGDTSMADDTVSDDEDVSQPVEIPDATDSDVVMEDVDTSEADDPPAGSTDDDIERLASPTVRPQENAERFLQTEQERYQRTRLMGESTWEETTTLLANGTELADAVDSNREPMHPFLKDQVCFGDN